MRYLIKMTYSLLLISGLFWLNSVMASDLSKKETSVKKDNTANEQVPEDVRTDKGKGISEKKGTAVTVKMPVYVSPLRGAPGGRVGGGTRGGDTDSKKPLFLCALAPDHVGLTFREQPNMYWFLSKTTRHPIEFTIIESGAIHPLLESGIPSPQRPGVKCIRLSDYNTYLKKNIVYKWFVTIVPEPNSRSKDILAGGMIQRVDKTKVLSRKLKDAGQESRSYIFADNGLWYDAMTAVSEMIDSSTDDNKRSFKTQRASLLEQVGLQEVVECEKQ